MKNSIQFSCLFLFLMMSLPAKSADYLRKFCSGQHTDKLKSLGSKEACYKMELIFNLGTSLIYKTTSNNTLLELRVKSGVILDSYILDDFRSEILFSQEVAKMGSGVQSHYLFRPKNSHNGVTVLYRTPYFSNSLDHLIKSYVRHFTKQGFNVVIQPLRGFHLSSNDHRVKNIHSNIEDARDIVNWISAQTWGNGKIISVGTSYDAYQSLIVAALDNKNVIGVFSNSPSPPGKRRSMQHYYQGLAYTGHNSTADHFFHLSRSLNEVTPFDNIHQVEKHFFEESFNPAGSDERSSILKDLLKTVETPIVLSYGYHGDHTSHDTFRLYDSKNPNMYLYESNFIGHSSEIFFNTIAPLLGYFFKLDKKYMSSKYLKMFLESNLFKNGKETHSLNNEGQLTSYSCNPQECRDLKLMESLSLTKDGDSNFSAKLKPGTINGFYKAVVEFSEVGMTHALELKFTPSLKREVSKDDLNDTEPLAKQSNNWFFELVPDKNIYVLSGNNIHIKVLDGDEIHLNLKVSNIAKNRNNLPQIKSIKLLIEYQNPDIKF